MADTHAVQALSRAERFTYPSLLPQAASEAPQANGAKRGTPDRSARIGGGPHTGVPEPTNDGLAGALAAALDQLAEAIMFVDVETRVIFANQSAHELLQGRRGLRMGNGSLCAETRGDTLALRRAIEACAQADDLAPCEHFLTIASSERAPLSVFILPLPLALRTAAPGHSVATVFIVDPERVAGPSAAHLQVRFGLTPAEAAVALQMLAGDGILACSRRLGVSETTARTHLRHVFQKTRTSRQAELVRVLLRMGSALLRR